jgi:hypothetical protein
MPGRGYYRLQELRCRTNRRGFAANARPIPTTESEILLVPAEVGIVAVIGTAKTSMMGAGVVVVGCGGVRSERPTAFVPGCKRWQRNAAVARLDITRHERRDVSGIHRNQYSA